jgi:chemotaxis protein histidine kinase CheA
MSQLPPKNSNSQQSEVKNSTPQNLNSRQPETNNSTSQNTIEGDDNKSIQGEKNKGVIGNNNTVNMLDIGRYYINYIQYNIQSRKWGKVVIALIPLCLFIFGIKAGADKVVEIFPNSSIAESAKSPTPVTSLPSNISQSDEFQFPQESCGDESTNTNNTWYPVFINGSNLDEIRQKYCRDAIKTTRKTGESAIQVAIFILDSKAQRFAKAVGGEVGEPKRDEDLVSEQRPSKLSISIASPSNSNVVEQPAAKRQAEAEAKRQAEAEAKRQAEAEAKRQAEAEAKRQAEAEAKRQAEAEAKRQAEAEDEAKRQAEAEAKRQAEAEDEAKRRASVCILTINNSLVSLHSEPKTFSQQLARVKVGEYTPIDYKVTNFGGLSNDGWYLIESEGRKGWVKDDTWTIKSKTKLCQ